MTLRKKTTAKILPEKPLTEVELEIMTIVWELGDCTVKDVQTSLEESRALAYTSVATMMKILEQKKFLASAKTDKAHTYKALVPRTEYETASLRHLANNLFQGDPGSMVMRLLDDAKLSQDELKEIQKLLDGRLRS